MAIHHFAPDDILTTRENAVVGVGIETNEFVLVHKGDVDGQVLVDQIHLLQGEFSRCNVQDVVAFVSIAILSEQGLQVVGKIVLSSGGSLRLHFGSGMLHLEKGKADFLIATLHVFKFFGTDEREGCGIEDEFFLLHQIARI